MATAYNHGDAADYEKLLDLVRPLREAGMPMHLAMGNHDQRAHFWSVIPADQDRVKEIAERQVLVVETPRANWVMLDSLDKTNFTPGTVAAASLNGWQERWMPGSRSRRSSWYTMIQRIGRRSPLIPQRRIPRRRRGKSPD